MEPRVLFTILIFLLIPVICLNSGFSNGEINRDLLIQKISLEDIRSFYKNEPNKELLEIISFKKGFALAIWESIGAGVPKRYEVFNLETGGRNLVYGMNNFVESYRILDEDLFIFHVFGKHSEITYLDFPFIVECHRNPYEYMFYQDRKERYFKLSENVEVGSYPNQKIFDVQIFPDGIKIVFELPGNGYAGSVDIPMTRTEYNEEGGEFSIVSSDTDVPANLLDYYSEIDQIGYFIKSLRIKQAESSSAIILKLHKKSSFIIEFPAEYYTGKIGEQLILRKGTLPYVHIIFSSDNGLIDQ